MPQDADIFRTQTRLGRVLLAPLLLLASFSPPLLAREAGAVRRFDIALENGQLTGGPRVVRVLRGDQVEILWTSDRVVMLHLHGYDIEISAAPGAPERMTFSAHATGRFPVEIHGGGRDRTLIHVEVHPR
jgi:hypothetical protein